MVEALNIRVRGIVQGVGFRPFVYRLSQRYLVKGWVLNDLEGVFIHAEGESKSLDAFVMEIADHAPAAARVTEIELNEVPLQGCADFQIRQSETAETNETTLVSADIATCDECLEELFDPANRRYRYPFINCTNCGPRFTIIDSLPYDRPATSMAAFKMCPDCAAEYADPADRRFHAQPDACWECGPVVSFAYRQTNGADAAAASGTPSRRSKPSSRAEARVLGLSRRSGAPDAPSLTFAPSGDSNDGMQIVWGVDRESSDAIFSAAVDVLEAGGILAVKGLGGFHLVCDAENPDALAALRERKHRDGKAFAVMVPDVAAARRVCLVDDAEAAALSLPARPIVLLLKRSDVKLAAGLADKLPELGIMLPATPVQHLLMHDWRERTGREMLVMTSGNRHDEPIVTDDAEAYARLGGIADAFIGNNRPIRSRYDDSVLRILHASDPDGVQSVDATQMIRRARGYAPVPLEIPGAPKAHVLAAGPEQKSTFTFALGERAFVSQHIGDVEDADTFDAWTAARKTYERLFDAHPKALACDLHPEYLTSKWAREQAADEGLPLVEVQHHHAHIASVLGEHKLDGPVCGIAFDGTGYGPDGAIWGGEVLLVNRSDYERFANFAYFPLPGGAAAIKNPLRTAYGALWAYDLLDHPAAGAALEPLGAEQLQACGHMVETGLNAPLTSSVGRLFDAVSALLGVCIHPTYEGEAAVLLDATAAAYCLANPTVAATDLAVGAISVELAKNAATPQSTAHDTSVLLLDAAASLRSLLDDLHDGVPVGQIAVRFHGAIIGSIVQTAELVRALYEIDTVVLSGGVFMNRLIVEQSLVRLGAAGFTVALNAELPPNDGCISFGQAVVAQAAL